MTTRPLKGFSIKAFKIRSVPDEDLRSMTVNTRILDGNKIIETKALIDCGAQGAFIDEWFAKEHQLPLLRLKKEIPVSNVDETPNRNGPIKYYTRLPVKIDGNIISTEFFISHLGKENIIFRLPWLEMVNPIVDWAKKTLKIDPKWIRKPSKSLATNQAIQALKVDQEWKRMRLKEAFAEELQNLHIRKMPTVTIEEIPNKDATPKFERLPDTEKSILIAVNELPNDYEDLPALIPDPDKEEDELTEGDLLIAHINGDTAKAIPEQEEERNPLNQPIQVENNEIAIRAKTSISQSLAHEGETIKKRSFEELVPEEYRKYRSVFKKTASEHFPESRPWDHRIDLKPDFILKKAKTYPLSVEEEREMNKFIDDNLRKGFIRESASPQASPFFFVSKKDSKVLRPCQDYRYLNESTIKNAYPLPSINNLLQKLHGAKIFMKLDIRWGYNNVWIKEGDEWKGAFITKRGLYKPTVMFFGMCNSPTTFQSMMNNYFTNMIAQGWVLIYIDNILIFSENPKDHHKQTLQVLKRLRDKDLFLKPEKCVFNATEVEYLGFIVKPNKISMDPTKLAGIGEWAPPKTVKGVRSFLGFCNFYWRFIGNYAEETKPLNELTKKTKIFEWSQECHTAFENLKRLVFGSLVTWLEKDCNRTGP